VATEDVGGRSIPGVGGRNVIGKLDMRIEAKFFSTALILPTIAFTPALAQQPNEKMLHRRAVEAAIWGMPAVSMRSVINATRRNTGGDWNDVVYLSKPMVSRHGFFTANRQVPYVNSGRV
jgi:hypothetical protein